MASTREIQTRIKSIQDTRKITNAMYMIASTKLRKARRALDETEPYFYALQSSMNRMLRHCPDVPHPFFDHREEIPEEKKTRGYLVITADKGMAGAYNHNVIREAEECLEQHENTKLYVVGFVGSQYFLKNPDKADPEFHNTAQDPSLGRARLIAEQLEDLFLSGELDEVNVIYTRMQKGSQTETVMQKLLPMERQDFSNIPADVYQETLNFYPSPDQVIENIGKNFMTGFVYGALVESYCCEQNARVMAMEAATDNANEMLHELGILYNRVRQTAITQEITEVISGAKAQRRKKKGTNQ